ncbi:Dyp-type peroxidase [Agitococcus lubricus]|uniref:Putative iron-dependent peroxidase n=1 Tax=Agitococcus lubricus TaxID=1077255 RepID=A0A2T5J471_9GAMM|nr:Dyp-type peroxidase [Agitococcus lubricus]PTQ91401.1 putative iron-dependent peroxidase [Agitococcus lubricus]
MTYQRGILASLPQAARYLSFNALPSADIHTVFAQLCALVDGEQIVLGLGKSLLQRLAINSPKLPNFPSYTHMGIHIPSTPHDLWLWLRGDDRGELLLSSQHLTRLLAPAFVCVDIVEGFCHLGGRDLTGYEDGTENPQGDEAVRAAFVNEPDSVLTGSSFVAVQQWQHSMSTFATYDENEQDNMMGRRRRDNEELDDAPESAHVKRTAQESFSPEAFLLRRSMTWATGVNGGLMFVAFGHSLQAFSQQLRRMVGLEDGISDALFKFTQPTTGAYYWCPPLRDGKIYLPTL